MTELTIDPASGLPALPEGYFWRVKACTNRYFQYTLELQLLRKWWIFNCMEKSMYCYKSDVRGDAIYLAREFYRERAEQEGLDNMIGDYPPKRWTRA